MKINYKKILIVIISIISVILIYKLPRLLINKNKSLPEVKLKEKIDKNKSFAIMISEDGNNYQEYASKEWPNDKYRFKEAKCIDNKGNLVENAVSFESSSKTVILETDKTVSCTLYFDHKETLEILRENDINGNISSEPNQGGMYRYQGTDNIANWICFGTEDNCGTNDNDIDKYMYRVIGLTPTGELYLIKETFIKEDSTTEFAWNDKYSTSGEYIYTCDNKICPEWNESVLFKRLNGINNGETQGIGSYIDNANTDIFVDSKYYDYLQSGDKINGGETSSEWYNLIVDHEWIYGDTIETSYNGDVMYAIESGKTDTKYYAGTDENNTEETYTWSEKVKSKISLMYIYDYVYASQKGVTYVANSWINFQKDGYNTSSTYEWFSTRRGIAIIDNSVVSAYVIANDVTLGSGRLYSSYGVRPVFYLSSKAKIFNGNGTKENPFRIEI